MDLPRFFRNYKHRQFNYIPVYYDQQKEELNERIRRIKKEESGEKQEEGEYKKSIIRGSFRHAAAYRAKANRASAIRTLLIILILLAFVLFLFTL